MACLKESQKLLCCALYIQVYILWGRVTLKELTRCGCNVVVMIDCPWEGSACEEFAPNPIDQIWDVLDRMIQWQAS